MKILVLNTLVPFVRGGAEVMADNLVAALREHGHTAELAQIPFKWYPARVIADHLIATRLLDVTEANGEAIDLIIPIKFPVYAVRHPNKVAWIAHQHRSAYEMWSDENGGMHTQPGAAQVRDLIRCADATAFGECRALFTIARNVSKRLLHYNNITSEPLYQPPDNAEQFRCEAAKDYFYFPSRISPWKRQSLVIAALAKTKSPVRVVFSGSYDARRMLDALEAMARDLGVVDRIEWRGRVSEEEKVRLYAESVGVLFPPIDEDYGFITLEAMLSGKPVITTTDAGGPLEFVDDGNEGIVAEATPESFAAAMDRLWTDRAEAERFGQAGRARYDGMNITWENVVGSLTKSR
jgi:glycosyltransferase involved in cell wall biosynthesis